MQDDKRQMRKLKRDVKKAGNRQRRAFYKRTLRDEPDEAHDAEFEFRKNSSEPMNGQDRKPE